MNVTAQDLPHKGKVCASSHPQMPFSNHSSDQGKEMEICADAVTNSYWYICKHIFVLEKYPAYIMKSTALMKHFLNIAPCTAMLL